MASASLKSTRFAVFVSLVIDLLAFTVILPLMPAILDYYSDNDTSGVYSWMETKVDYTRKLFGTPSQFNKVLFGGLIGSWFSLLQYVSMPITGSLSDIYGRKPAMIMSLIGISVSYLLWCFSKSSFAMFIVFRTVGGLSKGNISLSTAIVTDVSNELERGKSMALIGIAFSIGFIIGPVLGASFVVWSQATAAADSSNYFLSMPAFFALSLSVVNIIFVSYFLQESFPPQKQRAHSLATGLLQAYDYLSPLSLFSFRPVINIKQKDLLVLKRGSVAYFLFLYLYSGLEFTLTFLTHIKFNYTSMQNGKLYLFAGVLMTLIQGGYVRRVKPGNELNTVILGILTVIPSFIMMGMASTQTHLYLALTLYAFSSATVVPALTTVISSYGPSDQKGVILGIFRSIGAFARALGPASASLVFWRFGSLTCYLCGAVLFVWPLIMIYRLKKLCNQELQ